MTSPKAQNRLTQLIKDVRSRKFNYIPKEDKPIDWASYDVAQLNEMNDYLNLVRDIVDEINLEARRDICRSTVGRPPKLCFDLVKAVLVQQYFETSNRVTAGLMKLFKEKLRMREELTYKDIERAYENPEVLLVLRLLFEKTQEPVKHLETKFSGDGTGLPTSIKTNYERDKNDGRMMRLYGKMVGIVGTEYKLLSAIEIIDGVAGEDPFIVPLLERTGGIYDRIDLFSYDGAGYSYNTIRYITETLNATPRIFPPADAVLKSYGCMPKKQMLLEFLRNTQEWLREYHTRSISESRNSVDKRVYPRPLLKRLECRRYAEGYARACRYNVRQLVYVFYVHKVDVKWLSGRAS